MPGHYFEVTFPPLSYVRSETLPAHISRTSIVLGVVRTFLGLLTNRASKRSGIFQTMNGEANYKNEITYPTKPSMEKPSMERNVLRF